MYSVNSTPQNHVFGERKAISFPHGTWKFPAWPRSTVDGDWFAFAHDAQNRESLVHIVHAKAP